MKEVDITGNLIKLRTKLDITQEQMAKRLCVSRSSYASYETRRITIPTFLLIRIANEFDMTLDEIVYKQNN